MLNLHWCELLEQLFTIWVQNDSLALHAAFETGGLDFLLNKIGTRDQEMKELTWSDEEHASVVTIENEPGQNVVNYPPDWAVNKKVS